MDVRGMASPTNGENTMSSTSKIEAMLEQWIQDAETETPTREAGNAVAQIGNRITAFVDSGEAILTLTESDFDTLTYTRNARAYKGMRDGWNAVRDYVGNEPGLYLCAFDDKAESVTLLNVDAAPMAALEAHKAVYAKAKASHKRAVEHLKSLQKAKAIASRINAANERVDRSKAALDNATADARRLLTIAADSQEEAEA